MILIAPLIVLAALATPFAAQAAEYEVRMVFDEEEGRLFYVPDRLLIEPGDTVRWVHDDPDNEHDVVAYPNRIPEGTEPFMSPRLDARGQSWSHRFEREGTYAYHCHPHEAAGMRGVVIVGRESRPEEFRTLRPGEGEHADHAQADHEPGEHGQEE
ncbi:MAG: hypothetical protein FJX56_01545 [Alphaproteobacteria bacterium]|nr:hypothetical protein [Alphaproteobacteria bacterium]